MLDKLEEIKNRFENVKEMISDPTVVSDLAQYKKLNKEYKDLNRIVEKYEEYKKLLSDIQSAKTVLKEERDPDFREMAKAELSELEPKVELIEAELKELLIPTDPDDDKNAILEVRGGTGGDEAALFAGELFRMYQRYAEKMGWSFEILNIHEGSVGGVKEAVASVSGETVFGKLKFESGVHRVQRVPVTESQGRVHTSAASVAVLPEVDEVEVEVDMNDVRKDTFRASGAGGQHVNKTESAIRLTHLPTGIVVECQDERSQIKNFEKALKVLRSRIYDLEWQKQQSEIASQRKSQVRSGDRSEKIRTYNYPQGRVTDHRIGLSVYNLPSVLAGDIDEFIEKLRIAENTEKISEGNA
jgi:peptide chain release factor 1